MAIDRRSTVAAMVEGCGFMVDRSTVIDPVPVRECLHAAEAIARSRSKAEEALTASQPESGRCGITTRLSWRAVLR
jgi:hypothetical protein